ncbi:amino acid permease [Acetobacter fallax]|uniref:Amino acid permease n=1 Tax=Acetobacter fallax TaxID=1737473 RepID=A0ABX0KAK2_9PROT|nr:amino acid permease [Acetobacter fallax]NHO32787.1 amino acid permease [Acetobacter fallax]NHO36350.1 amino acid permease [Acetobacter fallax]
MTADTGDSVTVSSVVTDFPSVSGTTPRRLTGWQVSMISVGGIIGAGLFVGTSATIAGAGPSVVLAYVLAGAVVWAAMLLLGELAIQHEGRGSFISHVGQVLGQRSAFVTGWSYAFLWVVTGGAQAVAGGLIISTLSGLRAPVGSLLLVGVALLLNTLPVRVYGRSEAVLSVIKLAALGLFAALGVWWGLKTPDAISEVHDNLLGHGGFFPLGGWAVLAVVPMIVQTFTGCEIAFVAAVESEDPQQSIRRTVSRVPLFILMFYLGSVLVILSLRPWTLVTPGQSPFLLVMHYLAVPFAEAVAVAVTLVAVLSCLNSAKYVVSRVIRELSELGCAPAAFGRSLEHGVPVMAVAISSVLEVIIIASAAWSPSRAYAVLLGASGSVVIFTYFMVSLSCYRNRDRIEGRFRLILARMLPLVLGALFLLILVLPEARLNGELAGGSILLIALASVVALRRGRSGASDSSGQ